MRPNFYNSKRAAKRILTRQCIERLNGEIRAAIWRERIAAAVLVAFCCGVLGWIAQEQGLVSWREVWEGLVRAVDGIDLTDRIDGGMLPLAMAPVSAGAILGLMVSLTALAVVLAVRKVRQIDAEAADAWDPYAGEGKAAEPQSSRASDPQRFRAADALSADPLAVGGNAIPPSEEMPEGLTRLDAALIVHACGCEVGLIRSFVQGARRPSTEQDQAEALAVAERLLGDLRVTLWELRAKFRTDEGTALTGVTALTGGALTGEGEG